MRVLSRQLLLWLITFAIVVVPGWDWGYVLRGNPPLKWQRATGMYFRFTNRIPIDPEDFQAAIRSGANSWNGYADWYFSYGGLTNGQYGSVDGDSVFDYLGFPDEPDTPGETLPTANPSDPSSLYEVDSSLNSEIPLSTSGDPFSYDVQSVAVHEFGHWLFLDNVDFPGPVMYRYLSKGELRRALDQDDIDGIQYLYPGSSGNPQPPPPVCKTCRRVLACKICEPCPQSVPIMSISFRKKSIIESLGSEMEPLMLEQPKPKALLFAIVSHLPEIEHIALNYEDEMAKVWNPITDDWLPGFYWLSGDVFHGQNLVLTEERADRILRGMDVMERHSSRSLKRDIRTTEAYIRAHIGRTLQEMRSELFDEAPATSGLRALPR